MQVSHKLWDSNRLYNYWQALILCIKLIYCTYVFSGPICFLIGVEGKYSYAVYLGVAIFIIMC